MVQVSVAIPHGVSPGQMLQVPYNGMAYQIQVPSNAAAGQTITVNLPDAQPAVVQAVPVASAAVVPNMGPGAVYGAPQQHVPAAEPVEATPKGFESIPNASYVAAGEGHLPTAYFVTMPRLPSAEVLDNALAFLCAKSSGLRNSRVGSRPISIKCTGVPRIIRLPTRRI